MRGRHGGGDGGGSDLRSRSRRDILVGRGFQLWFLACVRGIGGIGRGGGRFISLTTIASFGLFLIGFFVARVLLLQVLLVLLFLVFGFGGFLLLFAIWVVVVLLATRPTGARFTGLRVARLVIVLSRPDGRLGGHDERGIRRGTSRLEGVGERRRRALWRTFSLRF